MAYVSLNEISKSFGAVKILNGVSLDIEEGEFIALVGPSGCGKSTLLRLIAGLEPISSGTLEIGNRIVNDLPPKERDVAMVFQNYALYPHMTTEENMSFSLRIKGKDKGEIRRIVEPAAEKLGLGALLERFPRQLSGGQRQRVAMGRSIVRNAHVHLFDEPLSNLDAKLRVTMRAEVKKIHRSLGATSIYVTHDQMEAMTMADRIVIMRQGKIEQVGSPLEIYDNPANAFVAQFIGSPSMNLLPAKLVEGRLQATDGQILDVEPASGIQERQDVLVGKRPGDIKLSDASSLRATVINIEPTGAETHLLLGLAGQDITCVVQNRVSPKIGDVVGISIKEGPTHFFNPTTEGKIN